MYKKYSVSDVVTAVAGVLSVAQFCFAVDMALKPAWVKWWGVNPD